MIVYLGSDKLVQTSACLEVLYIKLMDKNHCSMQDILSYCFL